MTPETWAALISVIQQFGLPLAMLAAFAYVIFKRLLVTKGELQDKQDELDEMRRLYERERADRISNQELLLKVANVPADLADAVAELTETVMKRPLTSAAEPYDDRLEGRRRGR